MFESRVQQDFTVLIKWRTLSPCNYYIVTVPTPTDKHNHPDLTPLIQSK